MRIEAEFWNHPYVACEQIITVALLDWATLMIDPKGLIVPDHVYRARTLDPSRYGRAKRQNRDQKSRWQGYIRRFYNRLVLLSQLCEHTFLLSSVIATHDYLLGLPNYAELTRAKR